MLIANTSATCWLCSRLASRSFRVNLCCDRLIFRGFVTADQKQQSSTSSKRKGHQSVTFPNRVFSGIQPSGVPHLGNYFGAIQKWKTLQDSGSDCVFSVVDLHSITKPHYDPNKLRENIELMTASLLACGIDPERCTLFLQSQVPEHAELSWILGCLLTTARLQHLPQLKDKTAGMKETPLGLYLYPVLQSADVLLYKATQVPVGNDQLPHIFLVQDTAELFNKRFGLVFPRPEPLLVSGEAGRLRHLRDPTKKMSKSSDDPRSYVALDDPPEAVRKKIKKALTDCISKVTYEPESRPAVANLVALHSLLTGLSPEEVCRQAEGLDTGQFKQVVADAAVSFLEPIQERMQEHLSDRARLWHILDEGSRRARQIAIRTMNEVHRASGMAPLRVTDSAKSLAQTASC
ncbi:tryptophan--tRNA ligase, mitochondrial [Dermacentor andersoni]|uniref:tryptophan--tRNA ligase, mitochondrial n=1 Tax=Dermacentor andersoni TaxID=34620 RepID=UPI002155C4BB|nr:tryptophan--tRNA ligase, mitochondrial-like [Dermacentor andersoni]